MNHHSSWLIVPLVGLIAAPALLLHGGRPAPVEAVSVGNLVYPSAILGTDPDPHRQVEEVVERAHAVLGREGLGIGRMLQHTIFLKDGTLTPMEALERFHAAARRLAPSLKDQPSVGTIIRVPAMPDPRAVVMLDLVAGRPLNRDAVSEGKGPAPDGYTRLPFIFGPQEIAETIADSTVLFTAGTEAMDFEHGTLPAGIDNQVTAIVGKLDAAVKRAGLSLGQMVQHNLYVTRGVDPMHVIRRFHEEVRKRDPRARQFPGTGAISVVDGMAAPGFLMEMDAVLTRGPADAVARVPFTTVTMDVGRAASVGPLVFVTSMPGVDFAKGSAVPAGLDAQVELAVRNVDDALKASGTSLERMAKYRIVLKNGAGDPTAVRKAFLSAVARLAPGYLTRPAAETLLVVEGLESPGYLVELSVVAGR